MVGSERPDPCAGLVLGPPVPVVDGEALPEVSGAVVAAVDEVPSVWVHQDSGHPAVLTRIAKSGEILESVAVPDLEPLDWEDIAAAIDAEGRRHLFVGDIGDNRGARPLIEIHRIPEPLFGEAEPADALELVLPDGARDAEALLVDPLTEDVIIVTKAISGNAEVLVAPGSAWSEDGSRIELEHVGTIRLGLGQAVLAGDLSPGRSVAGLRTPTQVLLWALDEEIPVAEALLASEGCQAPAPFDIFGEALALDEDGYVLLGESPAPELRMVAPGLG